MSRRVSKNGYILIHSARRAAGAILLRAILSAKIGAMVRYTTYMTRPSTLCACRRDAREIECALVHKMCVIPISLLHEIACKDIRFARVAILIKDYVKNYLTALIKQHTIISEKVASQGQKYAGQVVTEWTVNGHLHRENGPARIVGDNSILVWHKSGYRHRDDGPAVIKYDECIYYYKHGLLHREDGPAKQVPHVTEWWRNGLRHRANGPAVIYCDGEEWWLNGQLHREDGPAIVCCDGAEEWWLHGIEQPAPSLVN